MNDNDDDNKGVKKWRILTVLFLSLFLAAAVSLAVVSVALHRSIVPKCKTDKSTIDTGDSTSPGPFTDLTELEINAVKKYISERPELDLKFGKDAFKLSSNIIIYMELLRPLKSEVLSYLDKNGTQPLRWARVAIGFGALKDPVVKEFKVGPLPNPKLYEVLVFRKKKRIVPYGFRPVLGPELAAIDSVVVGELESKAKDLLIKSFGASFRDCGSQCLDWFMTPMPSWAYKEKTRRFWSRVVYKVDFSSVNPVDLYVLTNVDNVNVSEFRIISVWYNKQIFDNVDQLVQAYKSKTLKLISQKFPDVKNENFFSSVNLRGAVFPDGNKRPPREYEPDGPRYRVKQNHVSYMLWSFDYRLSTAIGFQIFDLRLKNQRIAYEISLQELAVYYSGNTPASWFADYIDSMGLIGTSTRNLVPGLDCPRHAQFLPARLYTMSAEKSVVSKNAICIFEHNNGIPLRRHGVFLPYNVFTGVEDYVLIMRTILLYGNYDYILDFVFHNDGVVEVRMTSTGYIIGEAYSQNGLPYGFQIHDNIIGSVHHHLFNFKVDLDIKGTDNRFETIDLNVVDVSTAPWSNDSASKYYQARINRTLKRTELEAAYKYDFENPKYLIFHNDKHPTKYGAPSAYRLSVKGMSKQLLPEDKCNEGSVSWARYQTAVTKYKEDEPESSSIYSFFDVIEPVVKFQDFIDDNDPIVDEDLVAWVTMGMHHIPHTEDLPQTTTSSTQLSFFLQPYNYFDEDPSVGSRDGWHIKKDHKTVKIYRNNTDRKCLRPEISKQDIISKMSAP